MTNHENRNPPPPPFESAPGRPKVIYIEFNESLLPPAEWFEDDPDDPIPAAWQQNG